MKLILSVIACLSSLFLGVLIGSAMHLFGLEKKAPLDGRGTSVEWASFTDRERSVYVEGYVGGYRVGSLDACDHTDKIFEIKEKPLILKDGTLNYPVAVCDAALDQFSRMGERSAVRANYSIYSDIITQLYSRYPKVRNVPFPFLMVLMLDKANVRTAEQLNESLRHQDRQGTF